MYQYILRSGSQRYSDVGSQAIRITHVHTTHITQRIAVVLGIYIYTILLPVHIVTYQYILPVHIVTYQYISVHITSTYLLRYVYIYIYIHTYIRYYHTYYAADRRGTATSAARRPGPRPPPTLVWYGIV